MTITFELTDEEYDCIKGQLSQPIGIQVNPVDFKPVEPEEWLKTSLSALVNQCTEGVKARKLRAVGLTANTALTMEEVDNIVSKLT